MKLRQACALMLILAAGWLVEAAVSMGIAASLRPVAKQKENKVDPAPTPGPLRAEGPVRCNGPQCHTQQRQSGMILR